MDAKSNIFEAFVGRLEVMATPKLLEAIKAQHETLENDILYKRVAETTETDSVLSFCQFIDSALNSGSFFPIKLPVNHLAFYLRTVRRLVETGALPGATLKQFDLVFSSASQMVMTDLLKETRFKS
jgi:hypothetical protein